MKFEFNRANNLSENMFKYEGGSICNENPFITPSTGALRFYAIYAKQKIKA